MSVNNLKEAQFRDVRVYSSTFGNFIYKMKLFNYSEGRSYVGSVW